MATRLEPALNFLQISTGKYGFEVRIGKAQLKAAWITVLVDKRYGTVERIKVSGNRPSIESQHLLNPGSSKIAWVVLESSSTYQLILQQSFFEVKKHRWISTFPFIVLFQLCLSDILFIAVVLKLCHLNRFFTCNFPCKH